MQIEKRSSFGWPKSAAGSAPCKNGMVAHYNGGNTGLINKPHSACRAYWKGVRNDHMRNRGWLDIGYSYGVCPHGVVFEGRGFGKAQAAQPGGNTTWTSCTFMGGPDEPPTKAQLDAWKELRAYLRGKGVAAAVRGHRDFVATSCPGNTIYKMVQDGTLKGAASKSSGAKPKEKKWPGKYYKLKSPMMTGANVKWIQQRLNAKGAKPKLAVDGYFGPKTDREVRDYQKAKKLLVDGIVGPRTWKSLAK